MFTVIMISCLYIITRIATVHLFKDLIADYTYL